jgi:hypothetical protein
MDIFDSDGYFARQLPFKAKQSSMLRAAVAALAAKQMTRAIDNRAPGIPSSHLSLSVEEMDRTRNVDWHYKAADYYDEGISYLRLYLHHFCSRSSPIGFTTLSPANSTKRVESPLKRKHSSASSDEDLLSAIAVFSIYESMNGRINEWKQ